MSVPGSSDTRDGKDLGSDASVARGTGSLADKVVEAFNATQPEPEPVCPACGGDGWYIGHEDECHDTGDCVCDGVQVRCECQDEPR